MTAGVERLDPAIPAVDRAARRQRPRRPVRQRRTDRLAEFILALLAHSILPPHPPRPRQSRHSPTRIVKTVTGAPTRKYCQNPIITPRRAARWTTIRLATEPRIVRLPANVAAIAATSHARRGSGRAATKGFSTSTAGTLLTRFDNTAVT